MKFKIKAVVLLLSIVAFTNSYATAAAKPAQPSSVYFKQFQDIFERVNRDYVQEPDKQKMTDEAISGMLSSLDPHSDYYTDDDLEDFITQTKGEFGGIGIEIVNDNGAIKTIAPIDDLPADKAGIKAGDYVVGVNGELVANLGFNKAVKEMRGTPGTKVKILVIKEDEAKPKELELTRQIVQVKPVASQMEDENIAYVRIKVFNEHTISDLKKAFKTLNEKPGAIKGIILDMRNNPGGLLEQAVAVSEYFIDSGVIVSTKGRNGANISSSSASKYSAKAPNVPMVVLVNCGSASASEIVAGALQDHKRALILGTKTFGKGSVQTFMQISQRAGIKITTAKYYTPNGRSIQAEGIEPDIVIDQAEVKFNDKPEQEKRFSEASLRNYLKNEQHPESKEDSKIKQDEKNKAQAPLKDKENIQTTKDNSKKTDKNSLDKPDNKNDKNSTNEQEDKKLQRKHSALYKKDYQFARAYDLILGLTLYKP